MNCKTVEIKVGRSTMWERPCSKCQRPIRVSSKKNYLCQDCGRAKERAWAQSPAIGTSEACLRCGRTFVPSHGQVSVWRQRVRQGRAKTPFCSRECSNGAGKASMTNPKRAK